MSIFTEETQKLILAELKETNALTKIIAEGWKIDSWAAVRELVRSGAGKKYFPVGTEFNVASTQYNNLVFTVVDHDNPYIVNPDNPADHNMLLMMRDVIYGQVFDAREAMYVVNADTWADGMPAGTYSFTLLANYDTTYGGGKTYYFTTTKTIPVGGCIVLEWSWNTLVTDCYLRTYESMGSMTALESIKPIEGSGGTSLGTGDGNSPHMSHTTVARYGYCDYSYSNIRQWLNSNLVSGWWKSSEEFDRPSSITSSGFLYGMDTEFLNVVGEVDIQTNVNTVWNVDGIKTGSRTTRDKFFLASVKEVGLGTDSGYCTWGNAFNYYDGASDTDRIKYDRTSSTSARYWWLRSPYPWAASVARGVGPSGALGGDDACYGIGAAAACSIY